MAVLLPLLRLFKLLFVSLKGDVCSVGGCGFIGLSLIVFFEGSGSRFLIAIDLMSRPRISIELEDFFVLGEGSIRGEVATNLSITKLESFLVALWSFLTSPLAT